MLRYDHARRMISAGKLKIADIAAICGYADQAHLNRDFKSFTGTSPTAWLGEDEVARTSPSRTAGYEEITGVDGFHS